MIFSSKMSLNLELAVSRSSQYRHWVKNPQRQIIEKVLTCVVWKFLRY